MIHKKKSGKRATLFNILMVLIALVILIFAFFALTEKYKKLGGKDPATKTIGAKQFELIKMYQEGEKIMFYIERAAPFAAEESVYDLVEAGGYYGGSPCGDGGNTLAEGSNAYPLWQNFDKKCFPTRETLTNSFNLVFNLKIKPYLEKYPVTNIVMPTKFNVNLNNALLILGKSTDFLKIGFKRGLKGTYDASPQVCGKRIVEVAKTELAKDVREAPPKVNCGPIVDIYTNNCCKRFNYVKTKKNCQWCAYFVSYIYKESGFPLKPERIPGTVNMKEYFEKNEQFIPTGTDDPQPGDVIFFYVPSKGRIGHVGIVEDYKNGKITTIEGNTGNAVKRKTYDISNPNIKGFGRLKSCSAISPTGKTVVIDPGHGTKHSRSGTGNERIYTLAVAKKLKTKLENKGIKAILTHQKSDSSEDLGANFDEDNKNRALMANKNNAALYFRIHTDSPNGKAAMYYPKAKASIAAESKKSADAVWPKIKEIVKTIPVKYSDQILTDATTYVGGRAPDKLLTGSRYSGVPTILVEMVPLDRKGENWIKQSANQEKIAQAMAKGIIDYIGVIAQPTMAGTKDFITGKQRWQDLVRIDDKYRILSGKTVKITLNYNGYLRKEVYDQFTKMYDEAKKQNVYLKIDSAWRSYCNQIQTCFIEGFRRRQSINNLQKRLGICAVPGFSNHHSGIAIDFSPQKKDAFEKTDKYKFLKKNAKKYKFIQPMANEPWHWEYEPFLNEIKKQRKQLLTDADRKQEIENLKRYVRDTTFTEQKCESGMTKAITPPLTVTTPATIPTTTPQPVSRCPLGIDFSQIKTDVVDNRGSWANLQEKLGPYEGYIQEASQKYNISSDLIKAIIRVECPSLECKELDNYRGLMQTSKSLARAVGCDWSTFVDNTKCQIMAGTRALAEFEKECKLDEFDQSSKYYFLSICYNSGSGAFKWLVDYMVKKTGKDKKDIKFSDITKEDIKKAIIKRRPNYNLKEKYEYPSLVINGLKKGCGTTITVPTDEPVGKNHYTLKPSFKTYINYDLFGEYNKLIKNAKSVRKKVIACLKAGSNTNKDEDVEACTKKYKTKGIDQVGSYYILFDVPISFSPSYIPLRTQNMRFGLLLADNIQPTKTKGVKVIDKKDENGSVILSWADNLASDVWYYEISYGGKKVYFKDNSRGGEFSVKISGLEDKKEYEFSIIAVDDTGNKGTAGKIKGMSIPTDEETDKTSTEKDAPLPLNSAPALPKKGEISKLPAKTATTQPTGQPTGQEETIDFDFNVNEYFPDEGGRIWIPAQANKKGSYPLIVYLHGCMGGSYPPVVKHNNFGGNKHNIIPIAKKLIDDNKILPVILAAPSQTSVGGGPVCSVKLWGSAFSLSDFVKDVKKQLKSKGIEITTISVVGHSGAGCNINVDKGIHGAVKNMKLYAVGQFDTCTGLAYGNYYKQHSYNFEKFLAVYDSMYKSTNQNPSEQNKAMGIVNEIQQVSFSKVKKYIQSKDGNYFALFSNVGHMNSLELGMEQFLLKFFPKRIA